jgi:ubiquinone/menaquinone biosynthesis C-methylase UbiE
MELREAIQLIKSDHLTQPHPSNWADLGCGSGIFTTALSHYLQPGSKVYAVDKHPPVAVPVQPATDIAVEIVQLDFVKEDWPFSKLDGVLMGNAFHYVKDKVAFIEKLQRYLKPDGYVVVIEYDTERVVPIWVPYPINFISLRRLFQEEGYTQIDKLNEKTSIYGNANLYAALIRP